MRYTNFYQLRDTADVGEELHVVIERRESTRDKVGNALNRED
jgi:hypothetical protein